MSKKDKVKSISKKLSNLARERNIPYRNISMAFYLERLLARLSSDRNLKNRLVFKGGYVGLRVYNSNRYTIDLDAILYKSDLTNTLKNIIQVIEYSDLNDCIWFKFQEEKKLLIQSEYGGVRQIYRTGLGEEPEDISRCDIVHFDIGVGDVVIPGPIDVKTPAILENETLSWRVYSIESIIAEKLHAFISRDGDSSRSKDIFDLAFYLPKADTHLLKKAIEACFKNRRTDLPNNIFDKMASFDFSLTEKGWSKVISSMAESITFKSCLDIILKELKKIKID